MHVTLFLSNAEIIIELFQIFLPKTLNTKFPIVGRSIPHLISPPLLSFIISNLCLCDIRLDVVTSTQQCPRLPARLT